MPTRGGPQPWAWGCCHSPRGGGHWVPRGAGGCTRGEVPPPRGSRSHVAVALGGLLSPIKATRWPQVQRAAPACGASSGVGEEPTSGCRMWPRDWWPLSLLVLLILTSTTQGQADMGPKELQPWLISLMAVVIFLFIVFVLLLINRLWKIRMHRKQGDLQETPGDDRYHGWVLRGWHQAAPGGGHMLAVLCVAQRCHVWRGRVLHALVVLCVAWPCPGGAVRGLAVSCMPWWCCAWFGRALRGPFVPWARRRVLVPPPGRGSGCPVAGGRAPPALSRRLERTGCANAGAETDRDEESDSEEQRRATAL
ncbi:small integral membrane protein 24 isoform X3 [Falco naumanni]|uniref:small integral membrane protein 24 isoform X3 n=1 Tax=Falco naumanni TaxID=148594 RepID=UPI001ADDF1DA|nr:small integral membrane protein 24 isoform X3 [Falco naumanni]